MKPLSERIGDRTHGATLMECEQWAEEVRLKDEYIAQLESSLAEADRIANKEHAQSAHIAMRNGELETELAEARRENERKAIEVRFWQKVNKGKDDECWEWVGAKINKGYGRFYMEGKDRLAHRVAWRLFIGEIEKGKHICHHCDNPGCMNPKHLFMGTNQDNLLDASRKGRLGIAYGENHGMSKLTDDDVVEIRKLYGTIPTSEIAQKFGISARNVRDVANAKTWRHI